MFHSGQKKTQGGDQPLKSAEQLAMKRLGKATNLGLDETLLSWMREYLEMTETERD